MLPTDILSILYTWPKLNQMPYLGSKWILCHKIKSNPYPLVYTSAFKINISCLKLKKHEPPRILLHFVLLHSALLLCIAFCVKSYYILRYGCYYILRRKLLHFALLLHFVSVIAICGVTTPHLFLFSCGFLRALLLGQNDDYCIEGNWNYCSL